VAKGVTRKSGNYRDHNDDDNDDAVTDRGGNGLVVGQPPEAMGRPDDCGTPVIEA